MPQLTPETEINATNIINRFAEYVQASANADIVWGTNVLPSELPASYFGGDTGGKAIDTGTINTDGVVNGSAVIADKVWNALINETTRFTRIRNLRAVLFVDGDGGNTGSRGTPGIVYDDTQMAHLSNAYDQTLNTPNRADIYQGNLITAAGLETFFASLQTQYLVARANTAYIEYHVCHASCHSSCHGSRGRR